jgi:hypothetical protein
LILETFSIYLPELDPTAADVLTFPHLVPILEVRAGTGRLA